MTGVRPEDPAEPMDRAQRESMEYWNGYYQGKAAAMRNMGVIRRTELVMATRRTDRADLAWRVFLVLSVLSVGWFAYVIEAGLLDRMNAALMGVNIGTFMTTCTWKRMSR